MNRTILIWCCQDWDFNRRHDSDGNFFFWGFLFFFCLTYQTALTWGTARVDWNRNETNVSRQEAEAEKKHDSHSIAAHHHLWIHWFLNRKDFLVIKKWRSDKNDASACNKNRSYDLINICKRIDIMFCVWIIKLTN